MSFNIFRVLEKDNKELIHSSFLKYLLENWGKYFYNSLFGKSHLYFDTVELEKSYKGARFDLEIKGRDGEEIIVIENKFKSLPSSMQLKKYDKVLRKNHAKKNIKRFLLCFDSDTVFFETEQWNIITYKQLLDSITDLLENESSISNDERVFIEHYHSSLGKYFSDYKDYVKNIDKLLINESEKNNRFWLRLIYSLIANKMEQRFYRLNEQIRWDLPTNTTVPLLNVFPSSWKVNGVEKLLIQLQGDEVKFYIHTKDKKDVQEYIDRLLESGFDTSNGKVKKINNGKDESSYIYKEKMKNTLPHPLDITKVVNYLIDFYDRIDKLIKE